ncbi:MAG: mercury resistance system transport protein MerF [Myxococcota bacterium]
MEDRKLLGVGVLGALLVAVCCFTPLLVALLAAVGLSAAVGYLDFVLLPALAAFAAIAIYALARPHRRSERRAAACGGENHV